MRIAKDHILELELPYREKLVLRRRRFIGSENGPRVAVVSGIHGDEIEGLYVCHLIAGWLKRLTRERPDALLGQVELYPGMNPLGLDTLERFVPTHGVDMNRNFPGHPSGLLPQRLTSAILEALMGCALVVDVHASNIYLREIPQVRINQDFADLLLPLTKSMNLDVIWLHGAVTVLEATLAHSLSSRGVPCLVAEMGVGMRVTPHYCHQLVTGLLNTWRDLGVLAADLPLPALDHQPLIADDDNVRYLNAERSGLFVPCIEHWTEVRKSQILGHISSPLHAQVLSEVRSPVNGTLFTLREYPLVYEGSLMARIVDVDAEPSSRGSGQS